MYSTAYQTVWAQRVREDEALPFFGKNKMVTPGRGVTALTAMGGKKQPTTQKDYLQSLSVGKPGTREPSLDNFVFNPNQVM